MLTKIANFVKNNQADIILVIGVVLISLLSFAAGYITAKNQEKQPLKIEFKEDLTSSLDDSVRNYDIANS